MPVMTTRFNMRSYNRETFPMALGLYISVPFCKQKCTFCNFASGVFSRAKMQAYVDRVCDDISSASVTAEHVGASLDVRTVDSVYLGGGTPTVLAPEQMAQLFALVRKNFQVGTDAEITVECAPGSLSDEMLATLIGSGVNRVSLGVQSFVDRESRAVGRTHTREIVLADIERLRQTGITNISVDLIAGLPHQTKESWERSLDEVIGLGVPHVSVYILEVDEDSRLGRELIAGGQRYHAHDVPDEELAADLYERAIERLNAAGTAQYEISNFAKPGHESKHNLKYWLRQPYFGFGVDASSMLVSHANQQSAVRFTTTDDLDAFIADAPLADVQNVNVQQAKEEEMFLGLRLNSGVKVGADAAPAIEELLDEGLLERNEDRVRLTARGRLLSNEVFARFIGVPAH
jgi:oxygen-independent coproporphyrinogen-3 oxidase